MNRRKKNRRKKSGNPVPGVQKENGTRTGKSEGKMPNEKETAMKRKAFARFLREINAEDEKIPNPVIQLMTDDEVIEGYRVCDCCDSYFWEPEDLDWALRRACCPADAFLLLNRINLFDRLLQDMNEMREENDYESMLEFVGDSID